MSVLTSDRERRLWLWTLAVVVAIFSTLALAQTVATELRNRGILDAAFIWSALLILAAAVALGLRIRPKGLEIGVTLGVVAVYLMVFVRMALPEKRTHLMEYGVVAVFIHEALKERASQGRRVPVPALVAIVVTALVGWIDEGIQALLPSRVYDLQDVGFNALAGLMAITTSLVLTRARRARGDGLAGRIG